MNRKEVKTKARVSSKAKFAKKIQRKDNKANSKQPKNSKKRRVDAKFRPSWSVGGDIDNQVCWLLLKNSYKNIFLFVSEWRQ